MSLGTSFGINSNFTFCINPLASDNSSTVKIFAHVTVFPSIELNSDEGIEESFEDASEVSSSPLMEAYMRSMTRSN
jgi:hypothetical protein